MCFCFLGVILGYKKSDACVCVFAEVDSWEIAPTFKDLLSNTSIQFCQDTVRSIQPCNAVNGQPPLVTTGRDSGGTVYLSSGTQVDYDW